MWKLGVRLDLVGEVARNSCSSSQLSSSSTLEATLEHGVVLTLK